jgi:signal peptidase I
MRRRVLIRTFLQPIVIAIVLAVSIRSVVRIYAIPSVSMVPTLQAGDHILVIRGGAAQRGDVVVFHALGNSDELMVKRIVATPGDLVGSANGRVTIGGHTLDEPYLAEAAASGPIAPQIVPSDCYFVLGDNRGNSFDSRQWGALPRELVVGRAVMVLWSSNGGSDPPANASPIAPSSPGRPFRLERLFRRIR